MTANMIPNNQTKARLISLTLFLVSVIICYGKTLRVKDIFYLPTDRAATDSSTKAVDSNGETCAIIKLPFPRVDESVISGDQIFKKEYHGNEWYIYMPPETFIFYIKYPGYDDLEIDLSKQFPDGVQAGKTYKVIVPYDSDIKAVTTPLSYSNNPMGGKGISVSNGSDKSQPFYRSASLMAPKVPLLNKNNFYFQAGYIIMGVSGLDIGIGGFISNVNMEGKFQMGFSKSELIYWKDSSSGAAPFGASYTPFGFDFRIGYGIILGRRFRLTPRLGFNYIVLKESADKKVADNSNAMGVPIGIRIELAVIKHLGISVEPAYLINVGKSKGYKSLSDISNKIDGFSNGFCVNVSLNCNF